jgi:hypothetical protein
MAIMDAFSNIFDGLKSIFSRTQRELRLSSVDSISTKSEGIF